MRAQLAHAEDDHVLRLATALPNGRAELRAMACIEPLIGLIDTGIGQVRQIAAGFNQIGLPADIAPDNAQLLAIAKAPQTAA